MSEAEGTDAETTATHGEDAAVDAERTHRLAKLDAMREQGIEPYPPRFDREQMLAEVRERFGSIAAGERTGESVVVAGRVMLLRRQGGIDFAALRDRSDELQLVVERDVSGEEMIKRFNDLDLGEVAVEQRPAHLADRAAADREDLAGAGVDDQVEVALAVADVCLLYTSPSPRDGLLSRMPSSA